MKTILFLALLFFPAFGFAEEYVFEKGAGLELCGQYHENIEWFHPRDIACDRKFRPEFKEFSKPKWEEWDLNANKDLSIRIKKFIWYGDQSINMPDLNRLLFVDDLKNYPAFGLDSVYFTRIDINNDGQPENVILYSENKCLDTRIFSRLLLVLNEDKTRIDIQKTTPLVQNPSAEKSLQARLASSHFNVYDVFMYKGQIYFDHWSGEGSFCRETLSVYELSGPKVKEICKYKTMIWCK